MLHQFLEHPDAGACTALRRVMGGGEPLAPMLARRFGERLPQAALFHMYGPTETTVASTARRADAADERSGRAIGRPIANTQVYVLDQAGEPAPIGSAGELHIGGLGVARGYLDRPELTAERFVADPFATEAGARMYRTGDLARWLADGSLEFLGRNDDQVKLRGYRVELGEIEARLLAHPDIRHAVALLREDTPGDQRLVAYIVADRVDAAALKTHLSQRLPEYMVPAAYVRLEALPLMPNGKVDRRALPVPDAEAHAARQYEAPEGETETGLAAIWSALLGLGRIGRRDHFFELGGHSLLATRLVLRIQQEMEVVVSLRDVFETPVLADLAERLLTAQLARFDQEELARVAETMRVR
jgi:acyl-coenzyme A synthetase/AMP-(fatty) acid ligase